MAYSTDEELAKLKTRRDEILDELAVLTDTTIGGKPNSAGPGSNVNHVQWRLSLYQELELINSRIILLEGPVEVDHQGVPR